MFVYLNIIILQKNKNVSPKSLLCILKDLHSIKRVERVIGRKIGWGREGERDKGGENRRIDGEDENGGNELFINSIDGK